LSKVVLDSSLLIASVFPETLTSLAKKLLKRWQVDKTALYAPALLHYELVAVSRKAVYQGRVTPEEGLLACDALLSYPVTLYFDAALLKRAYELASIYQRPTAYDSQYLALAERLACAFWTADQRLFHAVSGHFKLIRCLGQ
jgi:predicted nucleic acid-binding protein